MFCFPYEDYIVKNENVIFPINNKIHVIDKIVKVAGMQMHTFLNISNSNEEMVKIIDKPKTPINPGSITMGGDFSSSGVLVADFCSEKEALNGLKMDLKSCFVTMGGDSLYPGALVAFCSQLGSGQLILIPRLLGSRFMNKANNEVKTNSPMLMCR